MAPGRLRWPARGEDGGSVSVLALDLGTGSVKAALVDDDLRVLAVTSRPYAVRAPQPGAAETEPAAWEAAVTEAVGEVLAGGLPGGRGRGPRADPLTAVGLCGQMHGVVLLGADGAALAPAVLWPDTRAEREVERLAAAPPPVRARLGNPLAPGMAGPLLSMLARSQPGTLWRAVAAVQPKDWLRVALGGPAVVAADPSDASATLLWDVPGSRWDAEVCELLGVDVALLPPVRASSEVVGRTTGSLGLPPGLPLVTGAGDTAAAALGTGTVRPGRGQVSVGTGAQILVPLSRPTVPGADPVTHTYRAAVPATTAAGWYRMGAVQSAGLVLERVLAWLGAGWDEALAALGTRRLGDPVFLPHLAGERTPWLDPRLRGAWTGLGLEHDRAALLRSALTGVACAIADAWDAVIETGADPGLPLLVGGGSVHTAWRQLLADVLRTPLRPAAAPDAAVRGAAALALVGTDVLGLDDAVGRLDAAAAGPDAAVVEPDIGAIGWVLETRARFEDARHRLA
jgi:xylulokinase